MSKLTKNIISFALILLVSSVIVVNVNAQIVPPEIEGLGTETDIESAAVDLIQQILTYLGLIAIIIILLGGFKWMTSGGNEEKVGAAKKLLGAGIIGLVIILAAYVITWFVLDLIQQGTGAV